MRFKVSYIDLKRPNNVLNSDSNFKKARKTTLNTAMELRTRSKILIEINFDLSRHLVN